MKLQVAIALFFVAVLLFVASVLFYANSSTSQSAVPVATAIESSGFFVSPEDQYTTEGFNGPSEETLPSTHEMIRGTVDDVVYSSNKFAAYSDQYSGGVLISLSITGPEGDKTVIRLEDPEEVVMRECPAEGVCSTFADFVADAEDLNGEFFYASPGAIEVGNEIIILHRVQVGSIDSPADVYSNYDIYVTRNET